MLVVQKKSLRAFAALRYHPVNAGEVYNQRYRAIHQIGSGRYSTVWLVEDLGFGLVLCLFRLLPVGAFLEMSGWQL
jgi:hypothetical protein